MIHLLRVTSNSAIRIRPRRRPAAHACTLCRLLPTRRSISSSPILSADPRYVNSTAAPTDFLADPRYVDSTAAPADFSPSSAVVYPEAMSQDEADALVQDIQNKMRRRRYEKGHWDSVISHYKEVELPLPTESSIGGAGGPQPLSELSVTAIQRIRNQLERNHFGPDGAKDPEGRIKDQLPIQWIPCHGIDLKKDGRLTAHVDSVRYSGLIVAGLSLLSSSIMRLRPAAEYSSTDTATIGGDDATEKKKQQESQQHLYEPKPTEAPDDGHVDLYLPPRSLYVLSGVSRYEYTHELLDDGSVFELQSGDGAGAVDDENVIQVARDRRISVIFRDAKEG